MIFLLQRSGNRRSFWSLSRLLDAGYRGTNGFCNREARKALENAETGDRRWCEFHCTNFKANYWECSLQLTKEEKIHSVLICNLCSKTLQQAVHLKFMINQNNTQYFKKIENSKLRCLKCAKMFSNSHNLRRHANTSKCAGTSSSTEPISTKKDVTKPNGSLKRRMVKNQAGEPTESIQICEAEGSGRKTQFFYKH